MYLIALSPPLHGFLYAKVDGSQHALRRSLGGNKSGGSFNGSQLALRRSLGGNKSGGSFNDPQRACCGCS